MLLNVQTHDQPIETLFTEDHLACCSDDLLMILSGFFILMVPYYSTSYFGYFFQFSELEHQSKPKLGFQFSP